MKIEELYLQLSSRFPKDKLAYSLEEWGGAVPWVMMFSMLGKIMAKEMRAIPVEEKGELFDLLRLSMVSDDEAISVAIATGFLEGLYTAAKGDGDILNELKGKLDDASLDYLHGWLRWTGAEWGE